MAERIEHDLTIATLEKEVDQLRRIVETHQDEARALRIEAQKLQARAAELRQDIISGARQACAEAQAVLTQLERDTTHLLMLARRRVEHTQRALAAYQVEWHDLVGGD